MSLRIYIFLWSTILTLILPATAHPQGKSYWQNVGNGELENALKYKLNERKAKNVIIFIADGMGVNTVTAGRIYRAGEESLLAFESFPHVGMLKTYGTNKQVPDSACTATALFCGVKSNYETLGVSADVEHRDCDASLKPENRVDSFMVWAQAARKSTGIVTNTRITHATPAATYAKSADRHWECDSLIPEESSSCKDIARQLIEDSPGKNFNVILGGGLQCLSTNVNTSLNKDFTGQRKDNVDLIEQWAMQKNDSGFKYLVAEKTSHLLNIDYNATDYLLGIFTNSHMPYEYKRDKSEDGVPSLSLMATTAINILKKNTNGFVLMVEGGMIDQAHHLGVARIALEEVVQFSNAINDTVNLLEESGILDDTLIIVTSDHGHTLTINGYPAKGSNILGIATESKVDGVPWTTLTYAVGTKENYQFEISKKQRQVARQDPRDMNTTSYEFKQQSLAPHDMSAHGGGDVVVYAKGPMSHLIHSIHEQNYIAYVIAYAARIGPYATIPSTSHSKSNLPTILVNIVIPVLSVIVYLRTHKM